MTHPKTKPSVPASAAELAKGIAVLLTLAGMLGNSATLAAGQGLTLTAHEWGTITTLTTSNGQSLPGLFIDASPLPGFVNSLPFFAGAPAPLHAGLIAPEKDASCANRWKGVYTKMETPVLYFYQNSRDTLAVKVTAKFPGGTLHQFYPPRDSGEANPSGTSIDFAQAREGWIEWQAQVLPDTITSPYDTRLTHPDGGNSQEWTAPRMPSSNLIKAGGEIESYLFYRGLAGKKELPLKARFLNHRTLELSNSGSDSITHAVIYDQSYSNLIRAGAIWWQGALAPGETRRLTLDSASLPKDQGAREDAFQNMKQDLHQALTRSGLYESEASAMLSTWERSYWGDEMGFKIFWLMPRKTIDSLVPLQIQTGLPVRYLPITRVFIARSEILTPEFEQSLLAGIPTSIQDRHRVAYTAFTAQAVGLERQIHLQRSLRSRAPSHRFQGMPGHPWLHILPNGREAKPSLR